MQVKVLNKGEFLYQKGDLTTHFFFVLKGKLEIVVESGMTNGDSNQEFKLSKNVDEFEFFGLK
jgi:hypothetical protein